jgi:serine/threonine protein kinase
MNFPNPADCLENEDLGNGWRVMKKIKPHPASTGGHFSVGYTVQHEVSGKVAFLKALDFTAAFQARDFARELQAMTAAFNFERDLLAKCDRNHMRRILTPLADGTHTVSSCIGPLREVHFLIFDMAEGDIRKHKAELNQIDLAWCLRSMHHAAVGIMELHSKGIAHQDVKPSNVLTFGKAGSKLSDLGRAFDPEQSAGHDNFQIPGDRTYAPPELFYGLIGRNGVDSRKAIDLYALGNLIFFHFCGISATQGIFINLRTAGTPVSGGNFEQDLPYFQQAFEELLKELDREVAKFTIELREKITQLARELCNPNPDQRGDPKWHNHLHIPHYSVERYVSRFNLLARKAELGII